MLLFVIIKIVKGTGASARTPTSFTPLQLSLTTTCSSRAMYAGHNHLRPGVTFFFFSFLLFEASRTSSLDSEPRAYLNFRLCLDWSSASEPTAYTPATSWYIRYHHILIGHSLVSRKRGKIVRARCFKTTTRVDG